MTASTDSDRLNMPCWPPTVRRLLTLMVLTAVGAGCRPAAPASTPTPSRPSGQAGPVAGSPGSDTTRRAAPQQPGADPTPRPYRSVITTQAVSRDGLFKTHRIGSRLYFEIPRRELGQELLLVSRAARTPLDVGYGGQQLGRSYVLRWEQRDNRVLLRSVSYATVADSLNPMYQAVRSSNNDVVVAAFNIEAFGPDSAPVVDVSRLYTAPPPEFGPGAPQYRGTPDPNRSFVERVLAFPTNVDVQSTITFPPPPQMPGAAPANPFAPPAAGTVSVSMYWSMIKLPETPMMPRLADKRIGFFTLRQIDYGRPEQRSQAREYLVRWRLEKKDPGAAMSEPVKPITYYIDPATPDWLKPYVRRGVEQWQVAFEAAGFRRAIVAKDAPTPAEDPDWAPEDARYSVVRWLPSTIENAQGPNVHDPRTGEIIESDIYMYHNIMTLQRTWYFSQVGHLDPRARMWPYPDSLMGRLVEFVVAHEVGHTLGYQHDQKGSSTYPVDSLRSASWVRRMGHSPSIMDYSRFNYVAQPEDKIPLEYLVPSIGPWDLYITRWGYTPIPGARTPDEEWATLDRWSREQDSIPWYRFNMSDSRGADPGDHTEAVGDADPVKATGWGMRSIKQIVPLLIPAAVRPGQDYDDLRLLYDRLIAQWATELRHVAIMVGGTDAQETYGGQQADYRYRPWSRSRQREAVQFLNTNAFATPTFFLVDEVLRNIEVEGALRRINAAQASVLNALFNDRRLERVVEFSAMASSPAETYALPELLADVRGGIWSELSAGSVRIDGFRRELQRSYLIQARNKIDPQPVQLPPGLPAFFAQQFVPARVTSDIRSAFRAELRALDGTIRRALPRTSDRSTRAHLEDALSQIEQALEPRKP